MRFYLGVDQGTAILPMHALIFKRGRLLAKIIENIGLESLKVVGKLFSNDILGR